MNFRIDSIINSNNIKVAYSYLAIDYSNTDILKGQQLIPNSGVISEVNVIEINDNFKTLAPFAVGKLHEFTHIKQMNYEKN